MHIPRLAEDFYEHIIAEKGGSESTVRAYGVTLRQFDEFLEDNDFPTDHEEITTAVLRKFVAHVKRTGIKNATVARHIHALKSFWRYLVETHDLQKDPTLPLKTPRVQHKIPDVLSQDECQRLLEACEKNHFSLYRVRDRAILKLMMILGLRRGEVIALRLRDYSNENSTLKIVDSKNRKSRMLPVPRGVAQDLDAWLETRPNCDHDHLFCSRQQSILSPSSLYRLMDRVTEAAGLADKNIHPHMLRHTAATMALQRSGSLAATQQLLGHSDPAVTRIYCHLTTDDVRPTVDSNPLSYSGTDDTPNENNEFSLQLQLSDEEAAHLQRMNDRLLEKRQEYDELLESSPELRKRWRRHWIADWCRHACCEDSPMSISEAQRVVWDDEVVEGHSMRAHMRMCRLKMVLEDLRPDFSIPENIAQWIAEISKELSVGELDTALTSFSVRQTQKEKLRQLRDWLVGEASHDNNLLPGLIAVHRQLPTLLNGHPFAGGAINMLSTAHATRLHPLPIYAQAVQQNLFLMRNLESTSWGLLALHLTSLAIRPVDAIGVIEQCVA